jgi:hypothetical protein
MMEQSIQYPGGEKEKEKREKTKTIYVTDNVHR